MSWNVHRVIVSCSFYQDPISIKLPYIIVILTELYGFAGVIAFGALCWIVSFHVAQFGDQVKEFAKNTKRRITVNPDCRSNESTDEITFELVNRWKDYYVTINETVALIQKCFSAFLFIWIAYSVINLLTNAFILTNMILRSYKSTTYKCEYAFFLIRGLVNLFVLSVSPVVLNGKV